MYYQDCGALRTIHGLGTPEEVFQRIVQCLEHAGP